MHRTPKTIRTLTHGRKGLAVLGLAAAAAVIATVPAAADDHSAGQAQASTSVAPVAPDDHAMGGADDHAMGGADDHANLPPR
ncbi:hypothetical protein [Streptomyces sp. NPDC049585]|uniref:hypothetical protein n=1 Tax=Streptomyces sp. NPDC049585 TaxID=3155154 RepID=UPI00342CC51A